MGVVSKVISFPEQPQKGDIRTLPADLQQLLWAAARKDRPHCRLATLCVGGPRPPRITRLIDYVTSNQYRNLREEWDSPPSPISASLISVRL